MTSVAVPLRWICARTLAATQRAAEEAAGGWARAWGLGEWGPVVAERVERWPSGAAAGLDLAGGDPPPPGWTHALMHALFHGDVQGSAIADAAAADATSQLRRAVCRALGLAADDRMDFARSAPAGHLGAVVQVDVLGSTWWVRAPHAALERQGLLRTPERGPIARWNMETAVAEAPLTLQAVLGRVEVSAADVLNLAQDDVLLLPGRGLDAFLEVVAAGTSLRLPARLGTRGSHRALQWLSSGAANNLPTAA